MVTMVMRLVTERSEPRIGSHVTGGRAGVLGRVSPMVSAYLNLEQFTLS